jgi:hypothetical protein
LGSSPAATLTLTGGGESRAIRGRPCCETKVALAANGPLGAGPTDEDIPSMLFGPGIAPPVPALATAAFGGVPAAGLEAVEPVAGVAAPAPPPVPEPMPPPVPPIAWGVLAAAVPVLAVPVPPSNMPPPAVVVGVGVAAGFVGTKVPVGVVVVGVVDVGVVDTGVVGIVVVGGVVVGPVATGVVGVVGPVGTVVANSPSISSHKGTRVTISCAARPMAVGSVKIISDLRSSATPSPVKIESPVK